MMVGTKAIATLSTGYLNALEYAKSRVQGADLAADSDKAAPRVTITHHPDVRRSLMLQKAYAEGMRALVLYTACVAGPGRAGRGRRRRRGRRPAERVNDLLLPMVKGLGSERSYEQLGAVAADPGRVRLPAGLPARAVHPRRQDRHPVRGHHRDPGSGPVLPQDRPRPGPGADAACSPRSRSSRRARRATARWRRERELLATALEDVQGIVGVARSASLRRSQQDAAELYKVGQNTARLLLALGDLVVGWLLLRQAEVALAALRGRASERDRDFYPARSRPPSSSPGSVLPLLTAERADRRGDRQRPDGPARVRLLTAPTAFGDPVAGHCSLPGGAEGDS